MTNQEAADELQYAIDLIKQDGKDWLDERDIPILEAAISALQAQEAKTQLSAEGTTSDLLPAQPEIEQRTEEFAQNVPKEDLISRKAAIDALDNIKIPRNASWYPYYQQALTVMSRLPSAQPEPCDDAVSRKAAIDAALSAFSRGLLASPDIRKLPSVQPEPQWIPCSEMEPKKSGRYLCTHSGTGIVSPDYYTTQEQAEELFADPEDEYLDLEEYIGWTSKNVIAWMPLPKPYRAERRTE